MKPSRVPCFGKPVESTLAPWTLLCLVFGVATFACSSHVAPGPKQTAMDFAQAAARGDSEKVYELLDEDSRRQMGRQGVAQAVKDQQREMNDLATRLKSPAVRQEVSAVFHAPDGEDVTLRFESGGFRMTQVGTLTPGASSPSDLLAKLRIALLRRDYATLLPLLSPDTQAQVEGEVQSIADALQDPQTLDVRTHGDVAVVRLPDGHILELKREEGTWWLDSVR